MVSAIEIGYEIRCLETIVSPVFLEVNNRISSKRFNAVLCRQYTVVVNGCMSTCFSAADIHSGIMSSRSKKMIELALECAKDCSIKCGKCNVLLQYINLLCFYAAQKL